MPPRPLMHKQVHTVTAGEIAISSQSNESQLRSLFDIAERQNPKRAFLFVSKLLGRHIPVSPSLMRSSYKQLVNKLPDHLPTPVVCVGMAETAVGLGAGVYQEIRNKYPESLYISSTRHPMGNAELMCAFTEDHSHATDHLIYRPQGQELNTRLDNAKTIVLIDDEATTGNTLSHLLTALRQKNQLPDLERVVMVTLVDWSGEAIRSITDLPVTSVSLAKGQWEWTPNPAATPTPSPNNTAHMTAAGHQPICVNQQWGRLAMDNVVDDFGLHIKAQTNERVLVLGSNEFVFKPYLLAERLEQQGAKVQFSATTRSPISYGYAIESIATFKDNYGLESNNFAYNVLHQSFDRVLLCVETPINSVDPELLNQLHQCATTVEVVNS